MHLAGDVAVFGLFILTYVAVLASNVRTRRSHAINPRAYRNPYGDSPGADAPIAPAHHIHVSERWTRGTR